MNEARAREILYQRSQYVCERCRAARATEAHHRLNRSQGGQWNPSNLLHLCHNCHAWATVNPEAARVDGWSVAAHADPAAVPVRHWLWGFVLLDDAGDFTLVERPAA